MQTWYCDKCRLVFRGVVMECLSCGGETKLDLRRGSDHYTATGYSFYGEQPAEYLNPIESPPRQILNEEPQPTQVELPITEIDEIDVVLSQNDDLHDPQLLPPPVPEDFDTFVRDIHIPPVNSYEEPISEPISIQKTGNDTDIIQQAPQDTEQSTKNVPVSIGPLQQNTRLVRSGNTQRIQAIRDRLSALPKKGIVTVLLIILAIAIVGAAISFIVIYIEEISFIFAATVGLGTAAYIRYRTRRWRR